MITEYFDKICRCLESCKTFEQWISCRKMISNFYDKFGVPEETNELKRYSDYIFRKNKLSILM